MVMWIKIKEEFHVISRGTRRQCETEAKKLALKHGAPYTEESMQTQSQWLEENIRG